MNDLSIGKSEFYLMSSVSESKVSGIIKALNGLEDNLDAINSKVSDMKKQLSVKIQAEIDGLLQKTKEMATKEAESIIASSEAKAKSESSKILKNGDSKLAEIKGKIDANFDDAVKHVVSTVLKA